MRASHFSKPISAVWACHETPIVVAASKDVLLSPKGSGRARTDNRRHSGKQLLGRRLDQPAGMLVSTPEALGDGYCATLVVDVGDQQSRESPSDGAL